MIMERVGKDPCGRTSLGEAGTSSSPSTSEAIGRDRRETGRGSKKGKGTQRVGDLGGKGTRTRGEGVKDEKEEQQEGKKKGKDKNTNTNKREKEEGKNTARNYTGKQNNNGKKMYFQRQTSGNRCRMHAVNNALGRSVLSVKQFYSYCDTYDRNYGLQGSREYFTSHSPTENLLTFILRDLLPPSRELLYYPPPAFVTDADTLTESCNIGNPFRSKRDLERCDAFLNFSDWHVWANRKVGNTWYCFDSLQPHPVPIKPRRLGDDAGGYILICRKEIEQQDLESARHRNDGGKEASDTCGILEKEIGGDEKIERTVENRAGCANEDRGTRGTEEEGKNGGVGIAEWKEEGLALGPRALRKEKRKKRLIERERERRESRAGPGVPSSGPGNEGSDSDDKEDEAEEVGTTEEVGISSSTNPFLVLESEM